MGRYKIGSSELMSLGLSDSLDIYSEFMQSDFV